ncbi:prolactin-releasing peptide receptor-like [Mya arenaria]|uniref:prolactin-releasing peptide receptor-like n=1 Tax=Mya arenaria TaxID=6604 RepID=UPI0022E15E6E|nr:prolactin-releasing peptide receptor-like [Mya arenaria]
MDIFIEMNGTFENITDNFTNYEGLPTNVTDVNNTAIGKAPSPPLYIVISSTVLYSVIFLVGILGNLLVVLVITCSRRMKTAVNVYLVNLCVADLLVITICMPSALVDLFAKEVWYFGPVLCKLVPFLENTVANVSILTIVVISIERYKVIRHPLQRSVDRWATLGDAASFNLFIEVPVNRS